MSNYIEILLKNPAVTFLQEVFGERELYLVGGCVRDALRGVECGDLDFTTPLPPQQLTRLLTAAGLRVIPTGLKHQTVTVLLPPADRPVEITTFRSSGMNPRGGLVLGESIEEDLRHRDFTINAIALSARHGTLVDPSGGVDDLRRGIVRAVGEPEVRFREDPLRLMRMVRFACVFQFTVEESTFAAARDVVAQLLGVAVERVREEFAKMMVSPQPSRGIRMLQELGVLQQVFPEISAMQGFEQNEFHHLTLLEHTLLVLDAVPNNLELRLAALLHDIGKVPTLSIDEEGSRHFYLHEKVGAQMARDLLARLRFAHELIEDVVTLVATHMRPLDAGPGGLRRLLRDTGELFERWRLLKEADACACKINSDVILSQLQEFDAAIAKLQAEASHKSNLAIGGDDLIALGMTPGPRFGEILRALEERILDNPELNTKERLLELVCAMR